ISVTMMSRLMLNLHQRADTGIYSTSDLEINSPDIRLSFPVQIHHSEQEM
ncbi:hypothetical protein BDQ17DRAFT_1263533, partial [Cyathus striatus]